MTELLQTNFIAEICAYRDAALKRMEAALGSICSGQEQVKEAQDFALKAHNGVKFYQDDRTKYDSYERIFRTLKFDDSLKVYRESLDASVWLNLMEMSGMNNLMDQTAREQFKADLCTNVPEVTESTVRETFQALVMDADLIFKRGLAKVFSDLDRRFKSHDGFKIGSRIILTNIFDSWGSLNYGGSFDVIRDVERAFAVLNKSDPNPGALRNAMIADRGSYAAQQSVSETEYFKIRCYKNGNAHLWFQRDDLVEKANLLLAEYYGAVLADGVAREETNMRSKSGLPAKNLSYYATPKAVVDVMLRDLYHDENTGKRVLEPSAGTGNISEELWKKGYIVDSIEIDADRCNQLKSRFRKFTINGTVRQANFLQMKAVPIYDYVIMNPPFYGTHWMEHVMHAYDFLKPGGKLISVLPISAELGQTKKHKTFRKWASQGWRKEPNFTDLPQESFAASGTRINTLVFKMYA